jgi:hypothetical protein
MSLPVGVRSTRVRNLSSSLVENALSRTLPIERRMMSFGSLARFSAQSVSSTPASGRSWVRLKPLSFQKARTCGKTCSGVSVVLSQRSLPSRSILKLPTAAGAIVGVAVVAAAAATTVPAVGPGAAGAAAATGAPGVAGAAWKVEALTMPLEGW